jgi:hypothetical protein
MALRNFQTEIEEVSHRELVKQRTATISEAGKENRPVSFKDSGASKASNAEVQEDSLDESELQASLMVERTIWILKVREDTVTTG